VIGRPHRPAGAEGGPGREAHAKCDRAGPDRAAGEGRPVDNRIRPPAAV